MSNMKETAYDVVEDSLGTFNDKKNYNKQMNSKFRDASKIAKIDAARLRRTKDYVHYKKMGWIDNNPFELNPQEKFKDRVSPIFIKLITLIDDIKSLGMDYIVQEYFDKLDAMGIHIDYSEYVPTAVPENLDACQEAIEYGNKLQGSICTLADKIRDEDSVKAEELGFGPKKEYVKLISLLADKRDGKDIDDKIQQIQTDLIFAQSSYEEVSTDSINSDPEKNPSV